MLIRAFLPSVIWMGIIFFLSIIPGQDLPDFSIWALLSFDKLIHVIFYMVLSFQVMKGCIRQYHSPKIRNNSSKIAIGSSVIYGGFVEIVQEVYLIDRYGDWLDVLANTVGAVAGVIVFRLIFIEYIR